MFFSHWDLKVSQVCKGWWKRKTAVQVNGQEGKEKSKPFRVVSRLVLTINPLGWKGEQWPNLLRLAKGGLATDVLCRHSPQFKEHGTSSMCP